jgi:hypothetical protein
VSRRESHVQGGVATAGVGWGGRGAAAKQRVDGVEMPAKARVMQRGPPEHPVRHVWCRRRPQQLLDDAKVAADGRHDERRPPVQPCQVGVDALCKQVPNYPAVVAPNGVVQRVVALLIPAVNGVLAKGVPPLHVILHALQIAFLCSKVQLCLQQMLNIFMGILISKFEECSAAVLAENKTLGALFLLMQKQILGRHVQAAPIFDCDRES